LEKTLKNLGVKEGDTVYLGNFAFEYMEWYYDSSFWRFI
jgi:hypothetical protein